MSGPKVEVTIRIYERESRELPIGESEYLVVKSHWNRNSVSGMVVLLIDGKSYTVSKCDLEKAIERCVGLS